MTDGTFGLCPPPQVDLGRVVFRGAEQDALRRLEDLSNLHAFGSDGLAVDGQAIRVGLAVRDDLDDAAVREALGRLEQVDPLVVERFANE